ncbi:MAG: flippase-like domain-containing protein [Proteobacteria bacterium]|nr:flippase-like domain-containing protein [Pseudomonadota bacterium]
MRTLKVFYLLIGVALLGVVIAGIDLSDVGGQMAKVGFGILVILAIYFVAFAIDSFTWQMTIPSIPLNGLWAYRTWKLRMVGEAFNAVMPAGGMGGEPVKALMIKKHYGIDYPEGTASLILAKTINLIALMMFLIGGFVLMIGGASLPETFETAATIGLFVLGLAVALFFAIQRFGVTSLTGTWISQWQFAKRVENILHLIHDMDRRLIQFYTGTRGRFAVAVLLAFANWMLGVVEIYYAMMLLDYPISWSEAWIIEAVAQMVRTGTFFIPASIGAQEGAFVLVCGAITGLPSLGFSVSVIRRVREIIWILWGFVLGSMFSLKHRSAPDR